MFGAVLDAEQGGHISLQPVAPFTVERANVGQTNVLATTFHTASGTVKVTDSLNTGVAGRLPWAELARRIDGLEGSVEMTGTVKPGTCLNTSSPWIETTQAGEILKVDGVSLAVRTIGPGRLEYGDRDASVTFRTSPGSRALLAVVATEREPLSCRLRQTSMPASIPPSTTGRTGRRTADGWVPGKTSCDVGPWP